MLIPQFPRLPHSRLTKSSHSPASLQTRGCGYLAWLADNAAGGYAEYLRPFSLRHGWLSGPVMVSRQYGNTNVWPGDTFGISALPGGRIALSWGSAVGGSQNSAIWATVVKVAASG